ncbi:MAG: M3 family oligoendopeptidase [Dissulfurispiraceae bacterium]|jgi:oligoendopeptidase F|nr:M3 family oligoendopeptidase [Dissulfurispiraceae bacterium]
MNKKSGIKKVWNLKPLFESDNDPKIELELKLIKNKNTKFARKWRSRSDWLQEPEVLKQALDDYEQLKRIYGTDGNVGYYFLLRSQQDQTSHIIKAKLNMSEANARAIENEIRFFELQLAKVPARQQKIFLESAFLQQYRHFLCRIFARAKYLLSDDEEKILNLTTATSYANWIRMTSEFLSKEERRIYVEEGGKAIKNFSEITSLLNSPKKRVRDSAADAMNEILQKHSDTAEYELNSILWHKKTEDELRKAERPDTLRHVSDDIETPAVDMLVKSVAERFHIPAEYYRLKAKLMKVKKLEYHERGIEYGRIDTRFSYSESVRLVSRVLGTLDQEFGIIFNNFVNSGCIDAYPQKGKAGGAFCIHQLHTQPTYIMLNHTDKFSDVLTLAHEAGHGINNELMRKEQNALAFESPTCTAEVASTFMEDFVLEDIIKGADDRTRLSVMMRKLNDDVSTIFRQIALYNFETELHSEFRKKNYLSKNEIGKIFKKHMFSYMGKYVEQSEGCENWWIYWSHIRYFFYVYSYASGLLISKALQRSVKNDSTFINKVKGFLSAGSSDSPANIFKKLGIDIRDRRFWNNGLDEVETLLDRTKHLAKKLGKI